MCWVNLGNHLGLRWQMDGEDEREEEEEQEEEAHERTVLWRLGRWLNGKQCLLDKQRSWI